MLAATANRRLRSKCIRGDLEERNEVIIPLSPISSGRIPSLNDPPGVAHRRPCRRGSIYLVGLGPGDTELVTLKAARLLNDADRVYCFDFLREEVARFARPEALLVVSPLLMGRYVVPGARAWSRSCERPHSRSVLRGRSSRPRFAVVNAGRTVVLADSGDPTLFSPWFWIERALADLPLKVIPGVSAFNAANAVLNLSITPGREVSLSAGDTTYPAHQMDAARRRPESSSLTAPRHATCCLNWPPGTPPTLPSPWSARPAARRRK